MLLEYFWLIPLPVLATLILTLFLGNRLGLRSAWLAVAGTFTSFLLSLAVLPEVINGATRVVSFKWFLDFKIGFMLDPLTELLLLIVSLLATLIIFYSYGYMHGEKGLLRFFAEMQFFTLSMLGVVITDNLLQAFIFWELMGLCSYLLIGFWFHKPAAAAAAKKAFLTTRVGDVFLLAGIIILFTSTGSFQYREIFAAAQAGVINSTMLTAATLCVFGGVVGKSAQFPLHVWLPDAMEGPTPVSALIHAATMVKAGIYLVARLFPLFILCPATLKTMVVIGSLTALLTALMALVAKDFKRILAFSTLSQLGYMVVALGSLSYAAAIFHLFNHAFFKALLFLGAGSVIHGTGTNNIYEMGGVFKYQKLTAISMLMATISISGIPPFSGFWSKDEILIAVSQNAHPVFFWMLVITAFLTAFYMFRLYYVVFCGQKRSDYKGHESHWSMVAPLLVLAVFAVGSGLLGHRIVGFLGTSFVEAGGHGVMYTSVALAAAGILGATFVYAKPLLQAEKVANTFKGLYRLLDNRYYIDVAYNRFCLVAVVGLAKVAGFIDRYIIDGIIHLLRDVAVYLARGSDLVDHYIVDGVIRGMCWLFVYAGSKLRRLSSGLAQQYLLVAVTGIVLILLVVGGSVLI